ncbi:MAG: DUF4418 family protein [Coriobacteriales bacterium]|jgi:hypothetical protein|nr:DUF4418 family protein [Coriobacteriales bacterium]
MERTKASATAGKAPGKGFTGLPIAVSGILIATLPTAIYQAFEYMDGMPMRCLATAQAEIAVGASILVFGGVYFFSRSARIRLATSVLTMLGAVSSLAFPLGVTGLCGDTHMTCHVLTLPILIVSSAVLGVLAVIGILFSVRTLQATSGKVGASKGDSE